MNQLQSRREKQVRREMVSMLRSEKEITCLDPHSYIALLMLGLELLSKGELVQAKVTKGYAEVVQ